MSLDMSVSHPERGTFEINWLRNPFGLCQWVEDNVPHEGDISLYYVCNHWSYAKSKDVDRDLFYRVVMRFAEGVEKLDAGFFVFDVANFMTFVLPNQSVMPQVKNLGQGWRAEGSHFRDDRRYAIPMEHFKHPCFNLWRPYTDPHRSMLDKYKVWYQRMIPIAEAVRDGGEFYVSN